MGNRTKYLVLYSGGKDSFLATCRVLNDGNDVVLLSFNNGCMVAEKNLQHGADRLAQKYSASRVEYAGVYPTIGTIQRLNEDWMYLPQSELGKKYPTITNCQVQCLHCQSSMWVAAIAYCKAHNIKHIACGYKNTDMFCTGMSSYIETIKRIAITFGIEVETPIWELGDNNWERDQELILNQFVPKVLEPKCLVGRSPRNGLSQQERIGLMTYFSNVIMDKMPSIVNNLVPFFSSMKLANEPFSDDDNCPYTSDGDGFY